MKRIISCLLAVALALTPCVQARALEMETSVSGSGLEVNGAYAADNGQAAAQEGEGPDQEDSSAAVSGAENPGQPDLTEEPEAAKKLNVSGDETNALEETADDAVNEAQALALRAEERGQIETVIVAALDEVKPIEFTVKVSGADAQIQEKTVKLGATGIAGESGRADPTQVSVLFKDLPLQEYTVTVTAAGFATYTQNIPVNNSMLNRIQIMTGPVNIDDGAHPGVIWIGDVDGDGQITDADKDKMVDVLNGKPGDGLYTDLKGDDQTDLADLEYFAKSYKEPDVLSTVEAVVPVDAVSVNQDNLNVVEGNVEDLLTDQGGWVKLSPANNEPITEENPVVVDFNLDAQKSLPVGGIVIRQNPDNAITQAELDITYEENGREQHVTVPYGEQQAEEGIHYMLRSTAVQSLGATVSKDPVSGDICLDLGAQVPVKKVTIRIMGVKKNNNLAEISKVQFIGNMADRIPEPQKDIPQDLTVENGSQEFTLNWKPCVNVTGYEVWIALKTAMDKPFITQVTGNTLRVMSLGNGEIVDGQDYVAKVRSVNGEWRSEYSREVTASPQANKKPDAPDNLSLTPAYEAITASWKKMKGTDSYKLYYKKTGETDYRPAISVNGVSYKVSGLETRAEYEFCVSGVNRLGEGPTSLVKKATTIDMNPAKMPKYKRLNEAGEKSVSGRIVSATRAQGGEMKKSPKDTGGSTIWGTVDNDHESYYRLEDWDMGVNYHPGWGLTYEFDQAYEIQNIAFQSAEAEKSNMNKACVTYWNENGEKKSVQLSVRTRTDADGKAYFFMQLPGATMVKKINIGLTTGYTRLITVSEVNFYYYDSLEDDIMSLYQDDLHTVLRSASTTGEPIQARIDELRQRLNTKDSVSGEYHPDKVLLEKELQTAQDILDAKDLSEPVKIHKSIITGDVGRGFAGPGLNAWQPLGVTAAAGEKLNVYVGHKDLNTGANTRLKLVATQYHAESGGVLYYASGELKIGRNEINIPAPSSRGEFETGGALYVQYEGGSADDDYAVRVEGGTAVPVLDLYKVTDETEKQKRTEEYVNALLPYVEKMPQTHSECHQISANQLANVEYDEKNCILGATDILLDTMMLSLPAKQVLAGAGSGTPEEKAQNIVKSMNAMEEMMYLFYQHKGLNKNASAAKDQIPKRHLNIRYQRMFAGAFMYAAGNHIGIEYGSTSGLIGGRPVQAEDGKYVSGHYFGWGIAHEIGHNINQGAYAVAEITNNYFSVLAQAKDSNDNVRFKYNEVYKKVTSGTKGRAANVFTQLGLYWQLHLAYDNGYNYKTYEDYNEQLANLFFARVDAYARTPSSAPAPGNIALTLSGDSDQKLMRLACAAAQKDILEFFERWGMTPDADTIAYAGQFEKETRAIFYASDDARVYRLTHSGSSLSANSLTEAVGDGTAAAVDADNKNKVNITLESQNIPAEDILGYEITRCITANGKVSEQAVGFALPNADGRSAFTDTVTTMNNRVVTYKVRVIDQYLNRSAAKELKAVKIEHEGEIDKTNWTVTVNNVTAHEKDMVTSANEIIPCGPENQHPIVKAIDNDLNTAFTGTTKAGAEVILEFNQTQTVAAFKYTNKSEKPSIGGYKLSVQEEGQWKDVAQGTFDAAQAQTGQTVYFSNGGNVARYEATAVKLSVTDAAGAEIGISELDVLGVTGDNVDFRDAEDQPSIGKLKDDYVYQGGKIPADSIVFIGKYKGNPAYNVVMLYDQDGNVIGGKDTQGFTNADQMIFANVPDEGNIEDVYDGTWVYWIDPAHNTDHLSDVQKVRAELYRVDNAQTNEGERMVSDSRFRDMPAELPFVTISGTGVTGGSVSGNSPGDNSTSGNSADQ